MQGAAPRPDVRVAHQSACRFRHVQSVIGRSRWWCAIKELTLLDSWSPNSFGQEMSVVHSLPTSLAQITPR